VGEREEEEKGNMRREEAEKRGGGGAPPWPLDAALSATLAPSAASDVQVCPSLASWCKMLVKEEV